MAIQSKAALESAIADWLLRTDLTDVIPTFVSLAEARLNRDPRIRRQRVVDPFSVSAATAALPSDLVAVESLYFSGDSQRYVELDNVDPGQLADVRRAHPSSGKPEAYAVVDQTTLYLAPTPDAEYDLVLSYWAGVEPLSDSTLSNWLLERHPDIYLYASLSESAPYLRDDPRLQTWEGLLEGRLEALHRDIQRGQYGGSLVIRPTRVIGEQHAYY